MWCHGCPACERIADDFGEGRWECKVTGAEVYPDEHAPDVDILEGLQNTRRDLATFAPVADDGRLLCPATLDKGVRGATFAARDVLLLAIRRQTVAQLAQLYTQRRFTAVARSVGMDKHPALARYVEYP